MFHDRHDAGRQLADRLMHLAQPPPVVLGLPRGGVEVGDEIASSLHAQLDVLVVRKLGAPGRPELAIGAVTDNDGPRKVLNPDILATLQVDEQYIRSEYEMQLAEVHRRQELYRRGRPAVSVTGRTVIVVDDGIATGATVRAALAALSQVGLAKLVLAVPVAPASTVIALEKEVDELICLHAPRVFHAVGAFYMDFSQTTDDQVIALLSRHAVETAS